MTDQKNEYEGLSIQMRIFRATENCPLLKPDKRNKHGEYDYPSIDAHYQLITPLLIRFGILFSYNTVDVKVRDNGDCVFQFKMRLACVDNPADFVESDCFSFGAHTTKTGALANQQPGAATSYAIKTYLAGAFCARGGFVDGDDDSQRTNETTAPQRASSFAADFVGPGEAKRERVESSEGALDFSEEALAAGAVVKLYQRAKTSEDLEKANETARGVYDSLCTEDKRRVKKAKSDARERVLEDEKS